MRKYLNPQFGLRSIIIGLIFSLFVVGCGSGDGLPDHLVKERDELNSKSKELNERYNNSNSVQEKMVLKEEYISLNRRAIDYLNERRKLGFEFKKTLSFILSNSKRIKEINKSMQSNGSQSLPSENNQDIQKSKQNNQLNSKEECGYCGGNGRQYGCCNTGYEKCYVCSGTKYTNNGSVCMNCLGNGYVICRRCNGNPQSVHVKCFWCDGKGYTENDKNKGEEGNEKRSKFQATGDSGKWD